MKTRLVSMGFPGNIRELENILERAMIICEDEVILAGDLDLHRDGPKKACIEAATAEQAAGSVPSTSMTEVERDAIARAPKKWNGNRTKAAEGRSYTRSRGTG